MSFADYLRDRISNDYKNLIIRKLDEIRQQTEELKSRLQPSLEEREQTVRESMQNELARVQDLLDREFSRSRELLSSDVQSLVDQHIASWYDTDVAPFDQQLELLLSDIVSNVPAPPRKKNKDIESLADLMKKFDHQNTQSEILNTLLVHIAGWVSRAVLFVVKGEQAYGWAALGLGADWNTDRVKAIRIDLNKNTILSETVKSGEMFHGSADMNPDNTDIYVAIGNKFPKGIVACPIKVRGKIAGILYSDVEGELDENSDLPDLLFLATRAAGSAIDLLPLKPKTAPSAVPVSKEKPEAAVAPPPVPQADPPAPPPPIPTDITSPVKSVEEGAVAVAEETVSEADESEGTVIMPAVVPPPVLTEEEQKLHDDAKRFARLLVSEIKLYNEAQVAAGREHRDLYERLREDIERSRRMYQDRVPGHIHSSTNYFYEELVRTLANGDPQLLGM